MILIEKILMNKFPMKKILMKKIKYRIVEYNSGFKQFIKYSYNLKSILGIFFIIFFLYIKMTTNYYQKHKEKLRKEARERQ